MTEFLTNFHFIRPWILLLLIIPILFLWRKMKINSKASSWEDVCDPHLLKFLLIKENQLSFFSLKKIIYIGIFSAIIAAAGPSWKKTEIPAFVVENPNMFVLSLAQDMMLKDITPSRLDRAKFVISDLADAFPQGQFGIEVYSEEPYIISPISDDVNLLKNLLPQIVTNIVPDQGDRLDRAINLAIERFQSAGYAHGNIIIFTSDVGQRFDLALEAIQKAAQLNYKIYIVDASFSGNEKLQLLANKGNGFYISVKNTSFQSLIDNITKMNDEQVKLSQNLRSNFVDYGYYLLIIPLVCALFFFRRGVLLVFALLFAFDAQASFFLNENQTALRYFNNQKYEEAAQTFQDSVWKGVALFKADKLEDALKEFEKANTDIALYNKGLTLAKLCKYEEAKNTFQQVLKINPAHGDAQYNLSMLNDLFEKAKKDPSVLSCGNNQQQNQNSNQNNDKNDEQNQQNSSSNSSSDNNENNFQKNDNTGNEQQQNSSSEQNQSEDNQAQQNNSDNSDKQEQSQQDQASANDENNDQKNQPSESNDEQRDENSENKNQPSKANQDNGQEQKTDNKEGDGSNGTENQQEKQTVNLVNAQKGDKDDKYDEEAVIMQRQYRDIPEDTGGLLREFIKKEYSKGRYRDENI